ncbi:hypothetical protein GCM10007301_36920 [Azorhizobium oxalatiphilum]|uniref:Uncharacterized protein n=1 Tax=Azorhizobium oxalatiphilum TaxID=980631 RepID=A0A917C622_9HYPH|nr:hypothetical protein [Azorhizobium oxalatiphilum]GGF73732.1 hypothetical protein GCM10007301_36920 [Azorhizobium oxalatiphilum]
MSDLDRRRSPALAALDDGHHIAASRDAYGTVPWRSEADTSSPAPLDPVAAVAAMAPRIAAMRAHPAFSKAMLSWADNLVGHYDGNRLLNRLLNDRERAMFALMALYLNATPDETGAGLTAGRIIGLCTETGLCSRGRAKAMLVLMRWAGYVDVKPALPGADKRQRPLVPTALFISHQTERWRAIFAAASHVDPLAGVALARLDDQDFRRIVLRYLLTRFRSGERVLDHAPALTLFAARDGGLMVLLALALSGVRDGTFPPEDTIMSPVASLGRRFHVSRAHVLKLLRDAEAAGLVERAAGASGGVRLLPPLRSAIADFFAAVFLLFLEGAAAALPQPASSGAGQPPA